MSTKVQDRVFKAQAKLEIRAAKAAARRAERAESTAEARRIQAERATARRWTHAAQAERRSELAAVLVDLGRRLRPVAPLLIVTGFAMYGQVEYGLTAYSPADASPMRRLLVAVGAAVAVESMSLYVQWHAHDALLQKASATAARLRRASYLLALAVAAVNYSHFAGEGWKPTPGAVVFALFSASSPWLWGLHTRRVQRMQLIREGHVDSAGATFSAERWRAFPWQTWQARRWSIDRGVDDPRGAWAGFKADRAARKGQLPLEQRIALLLAVTQLVARMSRPTPKPQRGTPAAALPAPAPAAKGPRAAANFSAFLADPPAKAIELARQHGHPVLRRKVLEECHIEISEHEAKELRKAHRPNGQVFAS